MATAELTKIQVDVGRHVIERETESRALGEGEGREEEEGKGGRVGGRDAWFWC